MKDIKDINAENFRKVTVPLEISQIKEYFENKELFFLIDYAESKIKGNMFLTYITNLDLPCEILLSKTSKEERFELIKNYMETRNLSKSNTLKFAAAQILLEKKGFNSLEFFTNCVLTRDECAEFTAKHGELVSRWNTFISSTMVFMVSSTTVLEEKYQFKSSFELIDDPHYIGSNVVQLFSVPAFLEIFFSVPADTQVYYFRPQFEEHMFRGKGLFDYFFNEENTLFLMYNEVLSGRKSVNEIDKMLDGAMV